MLKVAEQRQTPDHQTPTTTATARTQHALAVLIKKQTDTPFTATPHIHLEPQLEQPIKSSSGPSLESLRALCATVFQIGRAHV